MVKIKAIRRAKSAGFARAGGLGACPQEIFEFLHALRSILVHLGYNKNTVQPYLQALTGRSRPRVRHGAALTTNHTPISIREQFRPSAIYIISLQLVHKQWQVTVPTKYLEVPCHA